MSRLERRWSAAIKEGSHPLLRLLSWGYGAGIGLRNCLYDRKIFKTHTSPLPTISVGNLLVGGSGKTPLVRYLAQKLPGKIAILTRGYRSKAEKRRMPTLVTPDHTWEEVGDEPLMLAKSLPDALVIVCADRVRGANYAKELGAERLLLDDGFQHRRLSRDTDIVCLPSVSTPALLPRGPLREPLSALKRADLAVAIDSSPPVTGLPLVHFASQASVYGGDGSPLNINGKRVALYCGIARPERFSTTVEGLGATVVEAVHLADHAIPTQGQLDILHRAGADLILCTEKDWVKLEIADGYIALTITPLTTFDLSL